MKGLGDFQTPLDLAQAVVAACCARGFGAARILEPTCGSGTFLRAAAAAFPAATDLLGIEYQRERYAAALAAVADTDSRLRLIYANVYGLDCTALPWCGSGPLLIIGNPPWVTAAALGRSDSTAPQPPRSNVKRLRGLDALTGAANFDVAEFLLLKLLRELNAQPLNFAVLVKESVARNVINVAIDLKLGVTAAEIVRIDARASFGVAVDACCLLLSTRPGATLCEPVRIRAGFSDAPLATFVPSTRAAIQTSSIVFRQGIKHDAADVFELRCQQGAWRNGYDEVVDVESAHVYPLRKARALHHGVTEPTALIVPHRRLGASTDDLQTQAPRLWRYLHKHAERLAARKSSIYRNAPRFALFGIGAYSFALWKVAVAGFYLEPRFRLIAPQTGRPVLLGDTAYFVGFERGDDARAFAALCESPALAELLRQRMVRGKRPVTKAVLDSVDWIAIARTLDRIPDRLRVVLHEPFAS